MIQPTNYTCSPFFCVKLKGLQPFFLNGQTWEKKRKEATLTSPFPSLYPTTVFLHCPADLFFLVSGLNTQVSPAHPINGHNGDLPQPVIAVEWTFPSISYVSKIKMLPHSFNFDNIVNITLKQPCYTSKYILSEVVVLLTTIIIFTGLMITGLNCGLRAGFPTNQPRRSPRPHKIHPWQLR